MLEKKNAKDSKSKWNKWLKIGGATVIGGGLIALTGGLAAPALAAGFAAVGLTAAGTFIATTAGTTTVYILFGAYGANAVGKYVYLQFQKK